MPRSISMVLFTVCFLGIILSAHAYVAWRLCAVLPWPKVSQLGVYGFFVAMALYAPLSMIYARMVLTTQAARPLLWVAYLWLGSFFLIFSLTAAIDLVALIGALGAKIFAFDGPTDPHRRLQGWRMVRGAQVALAAYGTWHAVRVARNGPQVQRVDVALDRLHQAQDGFTIAQISDLHVAALLQHDYVADVVRKVMDLRPDLIAVTGDMVDGSVADLKEHVAPLAGLKAPHGCYFITGNHEYYSGVDAWLDEVRRLGMRPLRNERVQVGDAQASFDLAGIDDWTAHHFGQGHGADLDRAVAGRDPSRELVLLAHQPRAVYQAEKAGVGLMLSGHTHGGQIFPFGFLVRLVQPFVRGLHRLGRTQIYVNRGTGFWGPPMRLGSAPEITLLTLRSRSV